jgi:uncharacterized protein YecE (DUF72 family)
MNRVGTAGWSLPSMPKEEGSRLQRYARMLPCAEINSSFYRAHRSSTWARWAAETPPHFRFSIKAPKTLTHESKLRPAESQVRAFFDQIVPLGEKIGPILFQLPPSLACDLAVAEEFFAMVRAQFAQEIALEPRHESWLTSEVNSVLQKYAVARVAADPPKGGPAASEPAGDTRLVYYRLHGSPRTYYSNYGEEFLSALATRLRNQENAWVIFDNTAAGDAYPNALRLIELLESS